MEFLKDKPLSRVHFKHCRKLTNKAVGATQRQASEIIKFTYNENLTDDVLLYIQGMPLEKVDFEDCMKISDPVRE